VDLITWLTKYQYWNQNKKMKKKIIIVALSCFIYTGFAQNNRRVPRVETSEVVSSYNGYIMVIFSVGFLAVVGLLLVARKNNKILKDRLLEFEEKEKKNDQDLYEKSNEISGLTRELAKLNKAFVVNQPKEISVPDQVSEPVILTINQQETKVEKPVPVKVLKFFGIPDKGGFFEKALEVNQSEASYVFELENEDATVGTVKLYNLNPGIVKEYLSSPKTYLDPVCDHQNTITVRMVDIQTVKEGVVALHGDKWMVTQKAIIKFI